MTKIMSRKYMIAAIAAFLLVAAVWTFYNVQRGTIMAQYLYYPTLESLAEEADVIIVCDVKSAGNQKYINIGTEGVHLSPYTVSSVTVTEVLKGSIEAGDAINVMQMGFYKSLPDAETKQIDGYLKKGNRYLLFLSLSQQFQWDIPCSPLNPQQGVVPIDRESGYVTGYDALFSHEPLDKTLVKIQEAIK